LTDEDSSSAGNTPSVTTRAAPYRSAMKRLRAVSRWTRPREICAHSWVDITRRITSKGQAWSMLAASVYTVNVMPIDRTASSAASCRAVSSSPSDTR
jgi:hypothetical protein